MLVGIFDNTFVTLSITFIFLASVTPGTLKDVKVSPGTCKLESEVFEINGKREGEYKSYHKNGQLYEIYNCIDGKRNGEYKTYLDNGQLHAIYSYIDEKINGEYKKYWSYKM